MSTFNAQQSEVTLKIQIANVIRILEGHEEKLRALDEELNTHSNQRLQYQLLGTICTSLDKLDEMGASDLFWDRKSTGYSPEKQLQRVRHTVAEFEQKIAAIESLRSGVQADIKKESIALHLLNDELAELEDAAEMARHDFDIVREAVLPYRPLLMPWSKNREDERRYRKIMLIVLFFVMLSGIAVTLLKRPAERREEAIIPEHIAELVVKKKPQPKPVERRPEKSTETKVEKPLLAKVENPPPTKIENPPPTDAKPATAEVQQARESAQTKGVLGALQNDVADLMGDGSESAKMGANARVSNSGKVASGDAPRRSVIGSLAAGGSGGCCGSGGSGGINTGSLGKGGTGTGGGNSITGGGVKVARVESSIGGGGAEGRPLSNGSGPSRTDEEIQIVFDRYKAALYRIYNRELRNDPTLRGKWCCALRLNRMAVYRRAR